MIMKNNVEKLLEVLNETSNPSIIAFKLSTFISDLLENKMINLYEAYLLNGEVINYTRKGYLVPAWNGSVRIMNCLMILNQRLVAHLFQDYNYAEQLKNWGIEALQLCAEKRNHYIMDYYMDFFGAGENQMLLQKLLSVREKYELLLDEEGPYHVEVFPYHYCIPEKMLLEEKYIAEREVKEGIEKILIELNI